MEKPETDEKDRQVRFEDLAKTQREVRDENAFVSAQGRQEKK